MELILFIGIQAAGKSTFYTRRFFDTHLRLNLDMLRTRHRERSLLQACLATQQRVVVDNTNPTLAERAVYIAPARAAGFRVIGYFFEPDHHGCEQRNKARARQVPPAGLFGTLKRLQRPSLEEGFDELHRVVLEPDGQFRVAPY
ncbi:AAA family ATPase [Stutzerimonas azotifigens]|uniref:AAA family ATPase n=1 Tax=Stutzerimonas azotifigens TaxID=291995 RepID=A0ABR5YX54_9GAMM|nr:AAA family ATPase [Stutzerimonas azotifigens]MBA1272520.1 AAA family ATPase [Stutzerimonas azotifigens]